MPSRRSRCPKLPLCVHCKLPCVKRLSSPTSFSHNLCSCFGCCGQELCDVFHYPSHVTVEKVDTQTIDFEIPEKFNNDWHKFEAHLQLDWKYRERRSSQRFVSRKSENLAESEKLESELETSAETLSAKAFEVSSDTEDAFTFVSSFQDLAIKDCIVAVEKLKGLDTDSVPESFVKVEPTSLDSPHLLAKPLSESLSRFNRRSSKSQSDSQTKHESPRSKNKKTSSHRGRGRPASKMGKRIGGTKRTLPNKSPNSESKRRKIKKENLKVKRELQETQVRDPNCEVNSQIGNHPRNKKSKVAIESIDWTSASKNDNPSVVSTISDVPPMDKEPVKVASENKVEAAVDESKRERRRKDQKRKQKRPKKEEVKRVVVDFRLDDDGRVDCSKSMEGARFIKPQVWHEPRRVDRHAKSEEEVAKRFKTYSFVAPSEQLKLNDVTDPEVFTRDYVTVYTYDRFSLSKEKNPNQYLQQDENADPSGTNLSGLPGKTVGFARSNGSTLPLIGIDASNDAVLLKLLIEQEENEHWVI